MELYLDTSDVAAVKKLARVFPLAGVTTNPSIVAAGKTPLDALLPELLDAMGGKGRLFAQVMATTADGLLSALAGAEYVAPYVNRVDAQGGNGIQTVCELQDLLTLHAPQSKVLAASFKTPRQALDCLLAGCQSITLPLDVAQQLISYPAVDAAVAKFEQDWQTAFGRTSL